MTAAKVLRRVARRLERAADIWNDLASAADDEPGTRFVREARGARRDARLLTRWADTMDRQARFCEGSS